MEDVFELFFSDLSSCSTLVEQRTDILFYCDGTDHDYFFSTLMEKRTNTPLLLTDQLTPNVFSPANRGELFANEPHTRTDMGCMCGKAGTAKLAHLAQRHQWFSLCFGCPSFLSDSPAISLWCSHSA